MNFLKKLFGNKKLLLSLIFVLISFFSVFRAAEAEVSGDFQRRVTEIDERFRAAIDETRSQVIQNPTNDADKQRSITALDNGISKMLGIQGELARVIPGEVFTPLWFQALTLNPGGRDVNIEEANLLNNRMVEYDAEINRFQRQRAALNGLSQEEIDEQYTSPDEDQGAVHDIASSDTKSVAVNVANITRDEIKCSFDLNFDVISCAKAMIIYVSTGIIIPLFGSILVGAAFLFDKAIFFSVTSFADTIGGLGSMQSTWAIIRDLANIFFIFILLYAAIGMTLRLKDIDAKKIIVRVIVIALLINFSAFFTRVVIDASNLLAYQFYNGIDASSKEYKIFGGTKSIKGVAGALMSGLSLEKQFTGIKTNPDGSTTPVVKGTFVQIISSLLGAIFVIVVSTFVILAGTIMLLIRIVTLVFLIILSPLAFFALAMPGKMSGQFDKWFSSLVSQCFFAPAYLIFLFVSSKLISGIDFSQGTNTAMNVWLQFFVVIGFLIASLIIASQMGAFGAQKAVGWAGKMNRTAFGTLTKLGKGGIRTAANVLSKEGRDRNRESGARISGTLKDWKKKVGENWNKDKKGEGGLAGAAWKAGVRTAKFGEKNVPLGKEVGEFLKKPLSTGSEHIATLTAELPFGFKSGVLGPTKDELAEKKKKEKDAKDAEREDKLNKKISDFKALDLDNLEDEEKLKKVKDFLKTITKEQITKLDKKKLEKIAHLLNSSYLDALENDMESGEFEKIKTAFGSKLAGFVSAEPKDDAPQVDKDNFKAMYQNEINKVVNGYEPKVLKRLPTEQITSPAVVRAMSAQMVRELLEHGNLSGETERLVKERVIQVGESHDAYGYVMRSTGRDIPSGPGGGGGSATAGGATGTPPDTVSGIDVPAGGTGI